MGNILSLFINRRRRQSNPTKLPIHHHFLYPSLFPFDCFGCSEIKDEAEGYHCPQCKKYFHKECAESPPEINHPSHPAHPLKLLAHGPPGYSDGRCRMCGEELRQLVYHCSMCNFSLDTSCARKETNQDIDYPKGHEHTLSLLPRKIPFTCDACGMDGDRCPYVCHQCSFIIHKDCVYLPRVIRITRHEHRISRTYFVGPGKFACKVCRSEIDWRYGGYRCSVCPDYVVHLRCATRDYVWDGRELEGEPEEKDEVEDLEPFKVINDKVINHFSHEHHYLKLNENGTTCHETIHCHACALPVYFDSFYKCSTCDFLLHETCANLPRKMRHGLHKHPLTLFASAKRFKSLKEGLFYCTACKRLCNGFRYKCCNVEIDVRCASIHEPFIHEGHPHPLFLTSLDGKICGACNQESSFVLNCTACDFALGFECATLPTRVKHKYDRHFLSLCLREAASGRYWCEICEKETDPNTPFYTCDECSSTLHIGCALGDLAYLRPGDYTISTAYLRPQDYTIPTSFFRPRDYFAYTPYGIIKDLVTISNLYIVVVPKSSMSRPRCSKCKLRCEGASIISFTDMIRSAPMGHLCSLRCFKDVVERMLESSRALPQPQVPYLRNLFQVEY